MDKDQIISFIQNQIDSGKVSARDVGEVASRNGYAIPQGAGSQPIETPKAGLSSPKTSWGIVNTLYLIGAVIVLAGIGILIYQHWEEIGFAGRVTVTLGIALLAYVLGLFLGKDRSRSMISQIMFILSTALAPLGIHVLLDQFNVSYTSSTQIFVALSLLIVFAAAQFVVRNNVLVIIMVAQGTWAYYALMYKLFSDVSYSTDWMQWATLVLGLAYILIAYGYRSARLKKGLSQGREEESVAGVLYGLGTLAILGSAVTLGGMWDILAIILIFGAFYGSVFLKNRSMLILGALFLVGHMIKLTSKYFIDSFSWPVALILCGMVIIAVAYGTFRLNKKYFGREVQD